MLTGMGVIPAISVPSILAFSNVQLGSAAQQILTRSNSGSASLSIAGLVLGGANGADFQITPGPCSVIAAGTSCGVPILFTPSAVGPRSATLTITSNTPNIHSPWL